MEDPVRAALQAIVAFDTPLPCGLLEQAQAALALSAAQPEGGDAVDMSTVNKICRMLSAGDFPHLADELYQAVAHPAPAQQAGLRYFADGPQGSFMTNDLELARALVIAYDKDDDWTITDLTSTAAKAAEGRSDG
jgi:hypothetical protein